MNIKKHIPNLVTLCNLLCGTLATIFAVDGHFELTAFFVALGVFLDFFDGFFARILKVSGELGKQLDSLADMVTSGVVPGIVLFSLLGYEKQGLDEFSSFSAIPLIGLLVTIAACYRLANFNLDTRQSESFIGLPTPAMSLFVVSLPLIQMHSEIDFIRELIGNNFFLISISIFFSFLMNSKLHLFSLKFKNYTLKENLFKYILIVLSVIFLITMKFLAVPIIILCYLLLSIIKNTMNTKLS